MKIWLDDWRAPPSDEWTWVKTFREAIDTIDANPDWEAISLDYVLNDFTGGLERTGGHVLRHLIYEEPEGGWNGKVWIHSTFRNGVHDMLALADAFSFEIEDREKIETENP